MNNDTTKDLPVERIAEIIKEQNISKSSFFIQKAEIEVTGAEGVERFIANIKYKYPDNYSISIRSKTGIEVARIFISRDTILANDRINRKLYCASPQYLNIKYGVTLSVLPILFGDYIGDNISEKKIVECINGYRDLETSIKDLKIKYVIDCKKGKTIAAIGETSLNNGGVVLKYSDFFKSGIKLIPGRIEIRDFQPKTIITLRILKISYPWDGTMEFLPGNKYEIIKLR